MRIGSLCTGYGGLDMATRAVFGGELAWWSDVEPGPIAAMEHHHPGVPNLGDLRLIDWAAIEPVDILTAGYPCQPFSNAGKRKGTDDPRHLWPWIAYGISVIRPRVVVLENVGAHLKRGFRVVAADLAALGYRVSWTLLRASDVGAAHRRERLFIVAVAEDADEQPRGERRAAAPRQAAGGRAWADAGGRGLRADSPADAESFGRGEGGGEPAGVLRRPDAPERGVSADALTLLPTPSAVSYGNNRGGAAGRVGKVRPSLEGIVKAVVADDFDWQEYEPAIRRWESALGRPAPYPAARGPRGGIKVAPAFGEWLMGLPEGHITDVPGLPINEQLKLVGNGVVPQQAERAIRHLCGGDFVTPPPVPLPDPFEVAFERPLWVHRTEAGHRIAFCQCGYAMSLAYGIRFDGGFHWCDLSDARLLVAWEAA